MSSTDTPKNFFSKIGDALAEVSELQVLTFTGTVETTLLTGGQIDWKAFFTKATEAQAKLILVAATQTKIDGDTTLFISSAPEATETLKKAHWDATLAAQKYRSELVQAAITLIPGK